MRGVPTGLIGNSLGGLAVVQAVKIDQAFTTIVGLAPAVDATFASPLGTSRPTRTSLARATAELYRSSP